MAMAMCAARLCDDSPCLHPPVPHPCATCQVCEDNPWLTYAAPLHRLREWGCQHKLMDILDEKALSPNEIVQFIELVLGPTAADLPNPQVSHSSPQATPSHAQP
jgi:hypothetical protein